MCFAEAEQCDCALKYIGSRYLGDKVVFVLEYVASAWLPADSATLGLPQSKASKRHTCLWESWKHSLLPLFSDYKLSPVLGMGHTVVKEIDKESALRNSTVRGLMSIPSECRVPPASLSAL